MGDQSTQGRTGSQHVVHQKFGSLVPFQTVKEILDLKGGKIQHDSSGLGIVEIDPVVRNLGRKFLVYQVPGLPPEDGHDETRKRIHTDVTSCNVSVVVAL